MMLLSRIFIMLFFGERYAILSCRFYATPEKGTRMLIQNDADGGGHGCDNGNPLKNENAIQNCLNVNRMRFTFRGYFG